MRTVIRLTIIFFSPPKTVIFRKNWGHAIIIIATTLNKGPKEAKHVATSSLKFDERWV